MPLGEIIQFDFETKKLYSKHDFKFFLDKHFREEPNLDRYNEIQDAYQCTMQELKADMRKNPEQAYLYLANEMRKIHTGGFVMALFRLDETRSLGITDFTGVGETWAYFELWKKYFKREILKKKYGKV